MPQRAAFARTVYPPATRYFRERIYRYYQGARPCLRDQARATRSQNVLNAWQKAARIAADLIGRPTVR